MTELDFESLKNIKVPEERLSARELALQSAMSEFDLKQKQKSNSIWSLISKINPGPFVRNLPRSIAASGALAGIMVAALASTIFIYNPITPPKPTETEKEQDNTVNAQQEKNAKKKIAPAAEININQSADVQRRESLAPQPQPKAKSIPGNRYMGTGNNSIGNSLSNSPNFNKTAPPLAAREVKALIVKAPKWKTNALHYCMTQNSECGKPVADQFCKTKGYQKSGLSPESTNRAVKTTSIRNNQVFENEPDRQTRTFQYITCLNPQKKKP